MFKEVFRHCHYAI